MDDKNVPNQAFTSALQRILRALARAALRRGVPFDAVEKAAKRAFVEVAHREFRLPGRKQTASRVSVLTGLHRKEVGRLLAGLGAEEPDASSRVTSAAAVITGWRRDAAFTDSSGAPAALPFDGPGEEATFSDLVRRYGRGDPPARAVLDELQRVGAVERVGENRRIRLLAGAYVPQTTSPEALAIFGTDVSDLIETIDHNLSCAPGEGYFQRKVAYDNVPEEALSQIRERVVADGQSTLEKLDRVLSRHDRDSNSNVRGSGRKRVMVGIYYHENDVTEEEKK